MQPAAPAAGPISREKVSPGGVRRSPTIRRFFDRVGGGEPGRGGRLGCPHAMGNVIFLHGRTQDARAGQYFSKPVARLFRTGLPVDPCLKAATRSPQGLE